MVLYVLYHYAIFYIKAFMSIVKISEELHEIARKRAKALNRSINMQVEHWMRIGKIIEENPDLTYRDVWQKLITESELVCDESN
jgi:hypothetical protein